MGMRIGTSFPGMAPILMRERPLSMVIARNRRLPIFPDMSKTVLLAATAALAFACNTNDEATRKRVDEVKTTAKDVKDKAEKQAERAKDYIDEKLDHTRAAADRRVDH